MSTNYDTNREEFSSAGFDLSDPERFQVRWRTGLNDPWIIAERYRYKDGLFGYLVALPEILGLPGVHEVEVLDLMANPGQLLVDSYRPRAQGWAPQELHLDSTSTSHAENVIHIDYTQWRGDFVKLQNGDGWCFYFEKEGPMHWLLVAKSGEECICGPVEERAVDASRKFMEWVSEGVARQLELTVGRASKGE